MGKADLHLHTRVSDGMATVEQVVDYVEHRTDLDVVCVTDHEDVTGGLRAREYAAKRGYRVEVVPGAEVTTLQGHVLGLFIERTPKSFRSVEPMLEAVHGMGGLAIVPHPMSWLTRSVSRRTLERLVARGEEGVMFDGLETGNPSPAGRVTSAAASRLNAGWGMAEVGGSDAHHLAHIGSGWTAFEGSSADDLRQALVRGAVRPEVRPYAGVREVGLGQLALGLVWGYSATPRKMLRRKGNEAQD